MTGVEILAVNSVPTQYVINWPVVGVFVIIGLFLSVWTWGDGIDAILLVLFFLIFGLFAGIITGKPTATEEQYKVTISDEVIMNEFLEHYEIVDRDGKIYTIREVEE